MPLIEYNTGTPIEHGVYACRVLHPHIENFMQDKFLGWNGSVWVSTNPELTFYEGGVLGWIGPLQRKVPKEKPVAPPSGEYLRRTQAAVKP